MQTEGRIRASALDWITLALVIIGGLNWGMIGLGYFVDPSANWNLVSLVLGEFEAIEATIYLLVGLAALYELYFAYQLYSAGTRPRGREQTSIED